MASDLFGGFLSWGIKVYTESLAGWLPIIALAVGVVILAYLLAVSFGAARWSAASESDDWGFPRKDNLPLAFSLWVGGWLAVFAVGWLAWQGWLIVSAVLA